MNLTKAGSESGDEFTRAGATPLAPHIVTLAEQASEQVSHLSVALETHLFLDSMLVPPEDEDEEDVANLFPSLQHLLVLKHALNAELKRHVKALAHTTDALHACATSEDQRLRGAFSAPS